MQEIAVREHEPDQICGFVAPLFEVDTKHLGGFVHPGADSRVHASLALRNSCYGSGTYVGHFGQLLE
jgi:hypothetical protein